MNPNQLATIIAYYLSKYDKVGVNYLGYRSFSDAFSQIAIILGAKKNYIRLRRDEFDIVHPWRKGWQRPMDNTVARVIDALQDLSEIELRVIVQKILYEKDYRKSEDISKITSVFGEGQKTKRNNCIYILRGPTGKKAEDFFVNYHKQYSLTINGRLIDSREFGCGYDFEIISDETFYIEVKGAKDECGGILFTSKEWEVANKYKEHYILAFVSNISSDPIISFISNPAEKIAAKKILSLASKFNGVYLQSKLKKFK